MFFKALRDNRGSTMVIYAVMFVALLGFSAVAVDTGRVIVTKQKLQDAVDAAALAAAMKLPNTADATAAANKYITLNGFSPSDIKVTFTDSNKTVVVKANKSVEYTFGKVLGLNSTTVNPGAKAQCGTIGAAFNYCLFSGSQTSTLTLNGSTYDIRGGVHSNYNFMANGSSISITGPCEAVGSITVNGSVINIPNRIPHASVVAMPDFSDTILAEAEAAGQVYNGDMTFNGSSIDVTHSVYVNGNITINGSKFKGVGCLFATGTITFNGSSLQMGSSDAVCVYSKSGSIKVNGASAEVDGILYAPNGNIQMNGSYQVVHGRVIGNTVSINGSSIQIIGGTNELNSLPSSYVKLIK